MTITIDTQKIFEKIYCPFMTKTFNKPGLEENFCNLVKGIYAKSITDITFNPHKLWFNPKIGNKARLSDLISSIQHFTGVFFQKDKNKQTNKQIGKERKESKGRS